MPGPDLPYGGPSDTFDTLDTSVKWSIWGTGSVYSTVGRLMIAPTGVQNEYGGAISKATYDMTGRMLVTDIAQTGNYVFGSQTYFRVQNDGSNGLVFGFDGGNMFAQKQIAGTTTTLRTTAWSFNYGLRLYFTAGQVSFEYLDTSRVWNSYTTLALPFAITGMAIVFGSGTYGTSYPGGGGFGGINVPPLIVSAAGKATASARFYDSYALAVRNHPSNAAYWRLGESVGATAFDNSLSGAHPGTYVGNPALGAPSAISGSLDGSPNFDGVDDYVSIPDFSPVPETYYGLVKRDAPQAYYRLSEPSGTSALDSSGNTKTGTFTGGTATRNQTGPLADGDTATRFQASYVQAPLLTAFNNSAFTIELWVRSNGAWTGGDKQLFCCGDGHGNDQLVHCVIQGTNPKLGFWFDDYTAPVALPTDTWIHLAYVFEGPSTKMQRIYVNGIESGTGHVTAGVPAITTGAASGNGIQIGRVDGATVADVSLDEVAVYPVALTPTQIAAHYAARNATGAITVEAWVKADSWANNAILCERRTTANVGGFLLYVGADGKAVWFIYTDGWHSITSPRVLALGVWHHIVGAYTTPGGSALLMINGEDNGRAGGWGTLNAPLGARFRIGTDFNGNGYFDGQIDEVAIYNTAIADATQQSHYALGVKSIKPYGAAVERTSGLLRRWTFDEAAGLNVFDHTGSGATATISGTNYYNPGGIDGEAGRYIAVDGMALAPALPLTIFSIEAWFWPDGLQGAAATSPAVISDIYPTAVNYMMDFDGGNTLALVAGIYESVGGWHQTAAYTLTTQTWHHLLFSYDGANLRLYVNGTLRSTLAWAGAPVNGGTGLRIGRRWDAAEYVKGVVDEVAIYNRALTQPEITEHWLKGINLPFYQNLTGSSAGTTTVAGTLSKKRSLVAASAGAATVAVQVSRRRRLVAASSGAATVSVSITRRRALVAASTGTAAVAVTLRRARPLAASSAGKATTSQALFILGLNGRTNGAATATGTLSARRALLGTSAASASTTALVGRQRMLGALADGTSTAAAQISKIVTLATFASAGKATAAAQVSRKRALVGTSAGFTLIVGYQIGRRRTLTPGSIVIGTSTTSVVLTRKRGLVVNTVGRASVSANLSVRVALSLVYWKYEGLQFVLTPHPGVQEVTWLSDVEQFEPGQVVK